jgi:hypothetical protein
MPASNKIISGIVLKKRKEEESNPWSIMGYLTVKTTLAVVNILIFVLGVVTISFASHILSVFTFGLPLDTFSRAVIALGAFVTIVGAIGIYGVFSEKGMYLRTYMGLIALAIILKAITVIIIMATSSQIDVYFHGLFESSVPSDIEKADRIQNSFECCGTTNCKFSDPCGPKLKSAYYGLAIPIGIAIGIEGLIIIICLLYISHLVKRSQITKSEIREAWKQNNEIIQKDYSNFDYA